MADMYTILVARDDETYEASDETHLGVDIIIEVVCCRKTKEGIQC